MRPGPAGAGAAGGFVGHGARGSFRIAQRKPRITSSWNCGLFHVSFAWPRDVPKVRAPPLSEGNSCDQTTGYTSLEIVPAAPETPWSTSLMAVASAFVPGHDFSITYNSSTGVVKAGRSFVIGSSDHFTAISCALV